MAATNPSDRDVYFNAPGVASVRWDQGASSVLVEWEGWADSTEFTTLLNAGVQALTDHHGSRWLADCRRQRVLKPADQEWGDKVWLPRAVAAGLKRFAIVLPNSGLASMNLKDREGTLRKTGLDVGYFATVEDAKQWLVR
jgi:hypothetical protein